MKNVILTAADEGFFNNLCQFIYSFIRQKEFFNSELICYDMGFSEEQRAYIDSSILARSSHISFREFDFSKYPDFVQLQYQTYSFKPIVVHNIFFEMKCNLLWLDSATILLKPLDFVWKQIDEHGVYAPIGGSGTLGEWTVRETLDYMNVPEDWETNRNICGCMCGFGFHKEKMRDLVSEWKKYGLIHECIKPEGANRANHRDDQSLLLYYCTATRPIMSFI